MTVSTDFYLIIGQSYDKLGRQLGRPSIRTSKGKPACKANEVAVEVRLQLPESLFKKPTLRATIAVPDSQAPPEITPEIEQNIAQTVFDQTGIRLEILAP